MIPDAIIAATAISLQLDIFTYNIKDFSFIKELKLSNLSELTDWKGSWTLGNDFEYSMFGEYKRLWHKLYCSNTK